MRAFLADTNPIAHAVQSSRDDDRRSNCRIDPLFSRVAQWMDFRFSCLSHVAPEAGSAWFRPGSNNLCGPFQHVIRIARVLANAVCV